MLSQKSLAALFVLVFSAQSAIAIAAPQRVACVGDSITFGSGIPRREKNSYPAQLATALGAGWDVRNFGVSGATLLTAGDKPYVKTKAFDEATEFKPGIVVIKLGTNDTKPQNWKHKAEFKADLTALVRSFQTANPAVRVFLCTPVPAFPGNFGINDEGIHEGVIPIVRETAAELKLPIIDLYAALQGRTDLFPDKVHPNTEGTTLIARAVQTALTASADGKAAH